MRPRHYVVFPDGGITMLMPKKYALAHALIYDGLVKTHDPSWYERMEAKVRAKLRTYLAMLPNLIFYGFWLITAVAASVSAGYFIAYLLAHAVFVWGG
jgi:hypothetical protein